MNKQCVVFLSILVLLLSACQQEAPHEEEIYVTPTLDALKNMAYSGFEGEQKTVSLINGRWQGEPFVKGGASRPEVTFVRDFHLFADLDADGMDDAVVLLNENSGGTGQNLYLAVVKSVNGKLKNVATRLIGDRVQIKVAKIEKGRILFEIVRAGKEDAACCPGEVLELGWNMTPQGLNEFVVSDTSRRLTPEALAYGTWVLRSWAFDKPVTDEVKINLKYDDGRFFGSGGCNRYFVNVKPGGMPGDISMGRVGGTRMACPDPVMVNENRFFKQLDGVSKFSFIAGQLALSYQIEDVWGVMLFDKQYP